MKAPHAHAPFVHVWPQQSYESVQAAPSFRQHAFEPGVSSQAHLPSAPQFCVAHSFELVHGPPSACSAHLVPSHFVEQQSASVRQGEAGRLHAHEPALHSLLQHVTTCPLASHATPESPHAHSPPSQWWVQQSASFSQVLNDGAQQWSSEHDEKQQSPSP